MKKISIGIDIGGTNTAIGVVDSEGQVLVSDSIPTPSHGDIDKYITDLAENVNRLIHSVTSLNSEIQILGIGIGAPNANYYKGTIEHAPNLSFKGIVPFVEKLKAHFPSTYAIALTNDANAAAIGEMVYGGAKGMKNFVMYTLGTGVGSGVVVDGKLVYGFDGNAGECGHVTIIPDGRLCGCGARGHLEAYCSAPGMKRTAFELLAKNNDTNSLLADKSFNEMSSKMIYDAAVSGDKVALEVFELTGKYLGMGLAGTIHHLAPEAIFLFGGPIAAGDLLMKPIIDNMEKNLLTIFRNKIKVLPSKLKLGDAAIVGASALVWQEIA